MDAFQPLVDALRMPRERFKFLALELLGFGAQLRRALCRGFEELLELAG
jgi:hypothetical protein